LVYPKRTMRTHTFSRFAALTAVGAVVGLSLVVAPSVQLAPAPAAHADTAFCYNSPDPRYPNLTTLAGHSIDDSETEVGAYIGNDFTALTGAQETEGNFVVGNNANYFTHTYSNIGVVGIGSLVTPTPGSDVLVAGGDINIGNNTAPATQIDVSTGSDGNIVAGGSITVGGIDDLFLNGGGTQTAGVVGALTPYASIPTYYNLLSTYYAGLATTGTFTQDANNANFAGDGASAVQIFSASGAQLGSVGASKKFNFTNIPANAVVIINVTGAAAAVSTQELVSLNGSDLDWNEATAANLDWAHFTQSVMWNFPAATAITIGDASQIPGSIDAPLADVTLLASTNGRVYVGGDLTLGGSTQTGLEMHNYSFRAFDCSTTNPGDLRITKSLTDPDGVVTAGRLFTGTYSCVDSGSVVVASGTWSLQDGQVVTITGIEAGAECTVTEDALTAPPSSGDATYSWLAPVYAASETVTIVSDDVSDVEVQNEVQHEVGDLEISKALTDPDAVVTPGRIFSGTYTCTLASVTVASGTWSVTTASTQTISDVPAGASCTLTENLSVDPSSTDSSYIWQTTVYSPSAATIVSGDTAAIEVQNSVRRALGDFSMRKVLVDPFGQTSLTRDYTGTFECTHLAVDVTPAPNTWTVKAGDPDLVLATDLPLGTVCSITEDPLTDPPVPGRPQFQWDTPTYSAASVTIGDASTVRITVTNTVFDPFDLPFTGDQLATPLAIAGGSLGIGGILLLVGYRRRLARGSASV
jgi:choice-of-anchor A domain-containing protein